MHTQKTKSIKRIMAMTGVVLIGIMVLATLITAFLDGTGRYFRSCLIVTMALPIAIWVTTWAYGAMTGKHTMASYDLDLNADRSPENAAGGTESGDDSGEKTE